MHVFFHLDNAVLVTWHCLQVAVPLYMRATMDGAYTGNTPLPICDLNFKYFKHDKRCASCS